MTPARRALGEALAALGALYLGAALFQVGLQPSGAAAEWQALAMTSLATSAHRFGAEVVTSFGPLGYLLAPPAGGALAVRAMAGQVAASALIAIAAWALLRRASLVGLFAGLAALLFAGSLDASSEQHVWFAILLTAAWLVSSASALPAAILAICAALLLYVNLAGGVIATALLVGSVAATYAAPPRPTARPLVFAVLFFAIPAIGLAPALLGSLGNAAPYFEQGAQLAIGYSAGLSRGGPPDQVWLAVASAVLLVADLVLLWQLDEGLAVRALLALAPAIFCAFKVGFVPQEAGVAGFFAAVSIATAVGSLTVVSLRAAVYSAALALCCAALGVFATLPHGLWAPQTLGRVALVERGAAELAQWRFPEEVWSYPPPVFQRRAGNGDLPDAWIRLIEERGGTVDAMPADELASIFRQKQRWMPSPTVDGRLASTPALDANAAAHFRGQRAPDFLVVALGAADLRHPLLDRPLAWRAIREQYQVAARDDRAQRVLLRRRTVARPQTLAALQRTFETTRALIKVPPGGEAGLVGLTLRVSMMARALRALFRLDPVHVRLKYADGKEALARVVPDLAEEGMALGSLPRTVAELAAWMEGQPTGVVRSFSLAGPGRAGLDEVVGVQWSLPGK